MKLTNDMLENMDRRKPLLRPRSREKNNNPLKCLLEKRKSPNLFKRTRDSEFDSGKGKVSLSFCRVRLINLSSASFARE
jgi:hypothetical protein